MPGGRHANFISDGWTGLVDGKYHLLTYIKHLGYTTVCV